jgi:predicted nucleotidyltransferase
MAMVDTQKRGLGIDDLLKDRRDDILRLADKHGATRVRVFGSVARGEARPDSDIDLLVDWDMSRISAWGGAGLDIELERLLGRKVDITTEDGLHWYIRDRVLREAVPL